MTEVAFHFNAPDRLVYACRLLRKAYLKGARVLVLADQPLAEMLDQRLWTLAGTEFVPHCRDTAAAALQMRTPIVISESVPETHQGRDVLVNLCDRLPQGYAQFARVIEVITPEAQVRLLARERWKQYKAAGFEPLHLDLQKPTGH
jgi:DNA polymerase-3 subunit chi